MGTGIAARYAWVARLALAGLLLLAALLTGVVGIEGATGNHGAWQPQPAQSAGSEGQGVSSSVQVTGSVSGLRVVVVDESDSIVAIFSNTADRRAPVEMRLASASGPKLDTTPSLQQQYEKLAARVDWGRTGLVYQRR